MPADLVLLSPTPLLFKHAYSLSAAARWMLAVLWSPNQHACWPFVTQYCMSAGVVLLYLLYLLVWCLTISCVCWYGDSLSAVPAGVVLHYRDVFSFGASLSAMPVGVVPHYRSCASGVVPHCRSCLLVRCINICHACWRGTSLYAMPAGPFCTSTDILTNWVQMQEGWLQVWRYSYKGAISSGMSADPVPLSDMPDCTVQLYQTCMLG